MIPKDFIFTKKGFYGTYTFKRAAFDYILIDWIDDNGDLFENVVSLQEPKSDNPIVRIRVGTRLKVLEEMYRLWHNIRMDLFEQYVDRLQNQRDTKREIYGYNS